MIACRATSRVGCDTICVMPILYTFPTVVGTASVVVEFATVAGGAVVVVLPPQPNGEG